jgi:hypothetical protein
LDVLNIGCEPTCSDELLHTVLSGDVVHLGTKVLVHVSILLYRGELAATHAPGVPDGGYRGNVVGTVGLVFLRKAFALLTRVSGREKLLNLGVNLRRAAVFYVVHMVVVLIAETSRGLFVAERVPSATVYKRGEVKLIIHESIFS